jgi:phosphate transport system protein
MREAYHEQLEHLADHLGGMCGMVADAMELATKALLDADLAIAEQVISDDDF